MRNLAESPQDFLTKTCNDHVRTPKGLRQDLFKSFAQGPIQGHEKASDSISLGSPQELLTRICKDLNQDLHVRIFNKSSQDRHTSTCCYWSGPCKIVIQEPPTRAFIQAPVRHGGRKTFWQRFLREDLTRISTRSSVKDLLATIPPGPPQDLLLRTCTRPCRASARS